MLLDKENLLSDDQAITTTAVSTNSIDRRGGTMAFTTDSLGNTPPDDAGMSPEVEIIVEVTEAFTAAGAATLNVDVVADDAAGLGSPTVLQSSGAIGKALLVPGYQFRLKLPAGAAAADRYLGLNYTVATGPMTAGKVTAGIVGRLGKTTAPGTFK